MSLHLYRQSPESDNNDTVPSNKQDSQAMNRILIILLLAFSIKLVSGQTKAIDPSGTSRPFVLGLIDEISSTELSETRTLNVYLPEGYNPNDTIKYPVIYLLDASVNEDFIHIVGLVQFNSFEWVNLIPKSIVVGIATVDRRRDFTFPTTIKEDKLAYPTTGHSDRFIRFIEKELQPFVSKKYKTSDSKTIIGQSLGGLLATEILLKRPGLFNKYIIISPSLWWDNGSLLNQHAEILKETYSNHISIYIGVGKEGLAPTSIPHVMEVDANVLAEKLKMTANKNVKTYFDYLPDKDHSNIMHQAVSNSFRFLFHETKAE